MAGPFCPTERRPLSTIDESPASSTPNLLKTSSLLPYSKAEQLALDRKGKAAAQAIEEELLSNDRREQELRLYVEGITVRAGLNKKEKVDQVLFMWEKKWIDMFRDSSKTRWALETIEKELRVAEQAVKKGERLTETRFIKFKRTVKLQFQPRKLYQTKPLWREAEIRSIIDLLHSMFKRSREQLEERSFERVSPMQEAVANETLFKWSQSLKLAVLEYVKFSQDPRADWVRVKFELKRIELLSRDPRCQTATPWTSPFFPVNNVLARIKEWQVPSNLVPEQVKITQLSSLSKSHRRDLFDQEQARRGF
ncbi:hypothetical protein JCM5353_008872 [Sporobolomyces roseus]